MKNHKFFSHLVSKDLKKGNRARAIERKEHVGEKLLN